MPIVHILALQYEIFAYLYIEYKIAGLTMVTDIDGSGEFSTKKRIWMGPDLA